MQPKHFYILLQKFSLVRIGNKKSFARRNILLPKLNHKHERVYRQNKIYLGKKLQKILLVVISYLTQTYKAIIQDLWTIISWTFGCALKKVFGENYLYRAFCTYVLYSDRVVAQFITWGFNLCQSFFNLSIFNNSGEQIQLKYTFKDFDMNCRFRNHYDN